MELVEEVAVRVEKLERENRRLKLAGGAVVAVLLAVALVGAVMPQEFPDAIEAREFRVVDENGNTRVQMNAHDGIVYYDENGTGRASMSANGITYADENGTSRAELGAYGIT